MTIHIKYTIDLTLFSLVLHQIKQYQLNTIRYVGILNIMLV